MKTFLTLFVLFFIFLPSTAWSEWEKYFEDKDTVYYYDNEKITKTTTYTYYKQMRDYKIPDPDGNKSDIIYTVTNCQNVVEFQYYEIYLYKQQLGNGKKIKIQGSKKWEIAVPMSAQMNLHMIICN